MSSRLGLRVAQRIAAVMRLRQAKRGNCCRCDQIQCSNVLLGSTVAYLLANMVASGNLKFTMFGFAVKSGLDAAGDQGFHDAAALLLVGLASSVASDVYVQRLVEVARRSATEFLGTPAIIAAVVSLALKPCGLSSRPRPSPRRSMMADEMTVAAGTQLSAWLTACLSASADRFEKGTSGNPTGRPKRQCRIRHASPGKDASVKARTRQRR